MASPALPRPDILIAGAGIIGLSLALELRRRGAQVVVLERDTALRQASAAAAGMLASEDPHNPAALLTLSRYSLSLYPEYLRRIHDLSGIEVPFQTNTTIQYLENGEHTVLPEHSLDPRQLAAALLAAIRAASVQVHERTPAESALISARHIIDATGAWARGVTPRKGQMLRVQLPASLPLREVHRDQHIYVVPRTTGPQAGSALIGATVEDAGYDLSLNTVDLAGLRASAAKLLPELASETEAPTIEAWAGLRPVTPDELPLLGRTKENRWVAAGHYRNGILLAPGTAVAIADLIDGRTPAINLAAFDPARLAR